MNTFWVQALFDDVPTRASKALMFFLNFLSGRGVHPSLPEEGQVAC